MENNLIDNSLLKILQSKIDVEIVDSPMLERKINDITSHIEIPLAYVIFIGDINKVEQKILEFINEDVISHGVKSIYLYTILSGKEYEKNINDNIIYGNKANLNWNCVYIRYKKRRYLKMRKYEEKEIKKVEETLIHIKCDECKKELNIGDYYYLVTTGYNEQDDPRDEEDICSDECLRIRFEEFLKDKVSTKYIEIEKEKVKPHTYTYNK